MKTETMLSFDALPMLIRDVGESWNMSVCLDCSDCLQKGSLVTYFALLVLPLATPTYCVDGRRIGRPALRWS
jgi:hypothetical protein